MKRYLSLIVTLAILSAGFLVAPTVVSAFNSFSWENYGARIYEGTPTPSPTSTLRPAVTATPTRTPSPSNKGVYLPIIVR